MIRALVILVLALLVCADTLARFDAPPPPLLIHADYPVCVTVHNEPLQPRRHGVNLYPNRSDTA